jgi:hypothetical protein
LLLLPLGCLASPPFGPMVGPGYIAKRDIAAVGWPMPAALGAMQGHSMAPAAAGAHAHYWNDGVFGWRMRLFKLGNCWYQFYGPPRYLRLALIFVEYLQPCNPIFWTHLLAH